MSGAKRPDAAGPNDRDPADRPVEDQPADGAVDGADPAESGYRRDDYWRQQQQDLPPDAGAESNEATG